MSKTLSLNDITIESRESDGYINATQLCKAGNKKFNDWYRLDSTQALINELTLNAGYPAFKTPVETVKGRYNSGSWIHPDLAVQLAQWISPKFAIQVSRWVRELVTVGKVEINSNKSDDELKELQRKLMDAEYEKKMIIEQAKEALQIQHAQLCQQANSIIQSKDDELNRMHNIQKELLSYKKRETKDEIIYVVSSINYSRQGIYKIGRTKNDMKFRSSSHNTTHIPGDKFKVLQEFKVNDSVLVEKNIHTKLKGLLLEGEREFFMCPYDLLLSIVDVIVHNDDEENDIVNKVIDTVYRLKKCVFNSADWTSGISEDFFVDNIMLEQKNKEPIKFDVTQWTEDEKTKFIAKCVQLYIEQQNKINQMYQINWKNFQEFLINKLSVPKYKFKPTEWKDILKKFIEAQNQLSIKWKV